MDLYLLSYINSHGMCHFNPRDLRFGATKTLEAYEQAGYVKLCWSVDRASVLVRITPDGAKAALDYDDQVSGGYDEPPFGQYEFH